MEHKLTRGQLVELTKDVLHEDGHVFRKGTRGHIAVFCDNGKIIIDLLEAPAGHPPDMDFPLYVLNSSWLKPVAN
jgi:hypothetical protein